MYDYRLDERLKLKLRDLRASDTLFEIKRELQDCLEAYSVLSSAIDDLPYNY